MRIGIDCGCLGVTDESLKVGVYNIVKNFLIELGKSNTSNTYLLYSFKPIEKHLMLQFGKSMKNVVVRPSKGWLIVWLPLQIARDDIDVFIGANQALPYKLPFISYKTIGVVYDIAFEKLPQLYSYAASVKKHITNSRDLAKQADSIIAISRTTKKDLHEIYNIPNNKIHVVYPGIIPLPKTAPFKTPYKYFLYVGALKKGKNIPIILKAYAAFKSREKVKTKLLLAGGIKWLDPEISKTLKGIPKSVQQAITFLGAITNPKELASLYAGAIAFISPSLYEGFGMPFVEAMFIGCPVIGSTAGSIPEIVGDAGVLVHPKNVAFLTKAMERIATNKKFRQKLIKKGKQQIKGYSWKTFAKAIYLQIQNVQHES